MPESRASRKLYQKPIAPEPTLIGPQLFRFLGVERHCMTAADWCRPEVAKLWTYNLHYFDDLNAHNANDRKAWHEELLKRWVDENPVAQGDGWEPYPVSRRIVNWIKWALQGTDLPSMCHSSLAVQTRWLRMRLEHHLLGNHLLANAKALIYAPSKRSPGGTRCRGGPCGPAPR